MKKILVVDDSASIRQMVTFTLESGAECHEAENGVEAFNLCQSTQFDVIISDINMPEMDGYELVKNLRGMSQYKYTPVIMLTTESGEAEKLKGREAGATGWIVKPFNPDKIKKIVDKVSA